MKYLIAGGIVAAGALTVQIVSRLPSINEINADHDVVAQTPVQQSDRERGVALARRGASLHDDKKYAAAALRLDSASAYLPEIRDWLTVFAASSVSFLGDTLEVAKRLEKIDSVLVREWTWRLRSRAFAEAQARHRALEIATAATSEGSASKRSAAWFVVAELQRDLGRPTEQRAALLRAIEAASVAEGAADAARLLAQRKDLTANESLLVGRALLRNGEPRLGVAALRAFIEKSTDEDARDDVRYEAGRTLFNIGDYAGAERQLKRINSSYDRVADVRFLIARAQYRQGKTKASLASFQSVVARNPRSQAATRALFYLGDLAQDARRTGDAVRYFKQAAARYELGGEEPAEALMRLGAMQYSQKKYAEAERTFQTYRQRYTRGVAYEQATYWAAQAAAAAGKKDTAQSLLRELDKRKSLSYYDVRAAQLLDARILGELPKGPATDTTLQSKVDSAVIRYALLREIGWYEAASFELSRLRERLGDNTATLYALAESLNAHDQAFAGIAIGRELLNSGAEWNERLLRIMYPLPYHEIIKREAAARGLDPYFVAALMRQESRFNTRAVSGAGAVGLMQVMPATGRRLAGVDREGLMDPEINIRLGTRFLADLMNTYDSRVDAVLAAYNAGPSRMNRWRSFPEFATPDLFVERIPFDETRDYVKVVRVNTSIYRELYAE